MPEPHGRLRLDFDGRWELGELASFLDAVRYAYAAVLDFQSFDVPEVRRRFDFPGPVFIQLPPLGSIVGPSFSTGTLAEHREAVLQRLRLDGDPDVLSIHSASPGWVEIFAKLNPLVVISDFVKWFVTRKEQRVGLELDNRKKALEAMLLENEVIAGRAQVLRDLGFTKREQRALLAQQLVRPLQQLEAFVDRKQITATVTAAEERPTSDSE